MGERRRASRRKPGRLAKPGRDKLTTSIDSAVLAGIRELARRKDAQICEVIELALQRVLLEDSAARNDATLAPLMDRLIETRHKSLEGGLRTMIARLAHENLTIQYILCNFLVEASIPPSKVEKWRVDGRKFAIHEFRRRPQPELERPPTDDDESD